MSLEESITLERESGEGFNELVSDVGEKISLKETAAWDKRYWLRISNSCNQRCIFCLDLEHHDGTYSDLEEIKNKIAAVHREGFTRLIVSGGEASIHPQFIDIITYANSLGFQKIQTITNGRMFSYKSFALKAVRAGLTEVTFSIHGHTAKLHNMLTATPKAFEQAMQGVDNLLAIGNVIISIDICVNKQNYKHVESIIKMFEPLGIYEFDLLHIIPFGASLGNKHALFYSYNEAKDYLNTVFSYKNKPGYFIWTNRFPPPYCEGHEDLIQDPHKFYDEIGGRQDLYQQFYREGQFSCYPHHCPFCFVKKFCRKFVYFIDQIKIPQNIYTLATSQLDDDFVLLLKSKPQFHTLLLRHVEAPLLEALQANKDIVGEGIREFYLEKVEAEQLDSVFHFFENHFKGVKIKIQLRNFQAGRLIPTQENFINFYEFIIELNSQNNLQILENNFSLDALSKNFSFIIPTYEKGSEAKHEYSQLHEVLETLPADTVVHNCAPCFHRGGIFSDSRVFNFDILQIEEQKPDMTLLVKDFILRDYYTKSSRCVGCDVFETCKGMHINYVRGYSYQKFTPLVGG